MTKKRLSGRERDRLARQKGAAKKRPVRKSGTPPKKETPKPAEEKKQEEVAQEKKESTPQAEKPKEESPKKEAPKLDPKQPKEESKPKAEVKSADKEISKKSEPPKKEEQKEEKEIKRSAPKTFSAIQKEGAAEPVKKQEAVKGETKSSVMAEQTENQTQENGGGDHSHLVENVSTKPLRYAVLASIGVVLIVFLSQRYGPSHDHGHSEATKTEEAKPEEMKEEAMPVMEESAEPAEEAEAPAEESAAPEATESETSEDETTSSNEMGEAVKSASDPAKLEKPIWGLATAAVKSESEAKQRASNLRSKGFDATYIYLPDYIPDGLDYYRVFIGPFPGESGARNAQKNYDQSDAYIFSIK